MRRVLRLFLATAVLATSLAAAPVEKNNSGPRYEAKKQQADQKKSPKKAKTKPPYQVGPASWYGKQFDGKDTASGEPFDMFALTAAHPTLPLETRVKVTNLRNGRSVVVRVNDRGPYIPGRIIDLSYAAASLLELRERGVERVRLDLVPEEPGVIASNLSGTY
ncbi:MAG TPA: septal ring lytic transglycosylase RlpA family protein [Terriglobales bacterium]|nr:septal ring lytic transglycosylase RlpA family protein [Terriglobales bacterium]